MFFKRHIHIILFIYSAITYSISYMIVYGGFYILYILYQSISCIVPIVLFYFSNEAVRHNFKCSFAAGDWVLSFFWGSENVLVFLTIESPHPETFEVLHRLTKTNWHGLIKANVIFSSNWTHKKRHLHFTCQFIRGVASHGHFSMPRCFGNVLVSWCYASLELIVPWGRHMERG